MFEINCRLGLAPTLLRDVLAAVAVGTGQLWPVRNLSAPGYPEKDMERVLREACCSNSRAKDMLHLIPYQNLTGAIEYKNTSWNRQSWDGEGARCILFSFSTSIQMPWKTFAPTFSVSAHGLFHGGQNLHHTNHTCTLQMITCVCKWHTQAYTMYNFAHISHAHTHMPLESKNFLVDFLVERVTPADWSDSKGLARLAWHQNLKWYKPCYAARAWRHRQLKKRG